MVGLAPLLLEVKASEAATTSSRMPRCSRGLPVMKVNWKGQLIECVNAGVPGWNFERAATWGKAIYHSSR